MGRVRRRRRRIAALAALPIAVTAATSATFGATSTDEAELNASRRAVAIGRAVRLEGGFPGASDARVEIRQRRAGADHFRLMRTTSTGPKGHFALRIHPDATGAWRAQLANPGKVAGADQPTEGTDGLLPGSGTDPTKVVTIDPRTNAKRIRVRSRVRATVSNRHPVVGHGTMIRGRVRPGGHRRVVIRVGGTELITRTNRRGVFERRWVPGSTGRRSVRVIARGNRVAAASRDRAGRLTVFRYAEASYYGPGFYGGRTACGQTLQPGTLGVAHKTLPCGTKVTFRYGGRQVTVAVIDRGPYVAGREFDLTEETKQRLGFGSTGTVMSSK